MIIDYDGDLDGDGVVESYKITDTMFDNFRMSLWVASESGQFAGQHFRFGIRSMVPQELPPAYRADGAGVSPRLVRPPVGISMEEGFVGIDYSLETGELQFLTRGVSSEYDTIQRVLTTNAAGVSAPAFTSVQEWKKITISRVGRKWQVQVGPWTSDPFLFKTDSDLGAVEWQDSGTTETLLVDGYAFTVGAEESFDFYDNPVAFQALRGNWLTSAGVWESVQKQPSPSGSPDRWCLVSGNYSSPQGALITSSFDVGRPTLSMELRVLNSDIPGTTGTATSKTGVVFNVRKAQLQYNGTPHEQLEFGFAGFNLDQNPPRLEVSRVRRLRRLSDNQITLEFLEQQLLNTTVSPYVSNSICVSELLRPDEIDNNHYFEVYLNGVRQTAIRLNPPPAGGTNLESHGAFGVWSTKRRVGWDNLEVSSMPTTYGWNGLNVH
ncbi:MAG: hypothetical protein SF028_02175 [Candidatus Sumerlaeia bacterium]|nr:hypothetical protein [Candidatus Sumerlaeia bacterium]